MNSPQDDSVVAEIRAVRRELAERFGEDINALCDFLVEREKEHSDRLVTRSANPAHSVGASASRK